MASQTVRVGLLCLVLTASALGANMCKVSSDFTPNTRLGAAAGGITCSTLNSFLLSKFNFESSPSSPSSWEDSRIDCTSVQATQWNGKEEMYTHLWHFGPSCCSGSRDKVRYATCPADDGTTIGAAGSTTTIVQKVTFQGTFDPSAKTLSEQAMGYVLGIWSSSGGWITGCSVSAAPSSRRAYVIAYTSVASSAVAVSTSTRASNVASNITGFNSAMISVRAGNIAYMYSTVPIATGAAPATVTTVAGPSSSQASSGSNATLLIIIIAATALALLVGVGVGVGAYCYSQSASPSPPAPAVTPGVSQPSTSVDLEATKA